jgi:hypothetical protein
MFVYSTKKKQMLFCSLGMPDGNGGFVLIDDEHGAGMHRVSHMVGAHRAPPSVPSTYTRVLRAVGAGVALTAALAVVGGVAGRGGRVPAVLPQSSAVAQAAQSAMSMGPAGATSPLFAQAAEEQNNDPAATKADNIDPTKDKMASGPAGSFSPIFAQAADELGKDGIAGGNSSATNEMPDAIKAWLDDMQKKLSTANAVSAGGHDPTTSVNVSVPLTP